MSQAAWCQRKLHDLSDPANVSKPPSGRRRCRPCERERRRRAEGLEDAREKARQYRRENRDRILEAGRAWRRARGVAEAGSPEHIAKLKAANPRRTHCKHGHPWTEENTYRPPYRPEMRMCRACLRRNSSALQRRRRREAGVPERPRSTEEEREALVTLVRAGQPISSAARLLGRSPAWGYRLAAQASVRSTWRPEPRPLASRFWSKVDRRDPTDCWPWRGALLPSGYGRFGSAGRSLRAHRVAWELENGPISTGKVIAHWCDQRDCCNPAHLWLTTQAANVADGVRKGRLSPQWLPGEQESRQGSAPGTPA